VAVSAGSSNRCAASHFSCTTGTGAGAVDPAVAQQKAEQPPPGPQQIVEQIRAGAAQVANGLLARAGHPDGGELAGAEQAGQPAAIAPIGLDLVPGRVPVPDARATRTKSGPAWLTSSTSGYRSLCAGCRLRTTESSGLVRRVSRE
jgi:hypothetical protein